MLFSVNKITPSSNGGSIVTISEVVNTGVSSVQTAFGIQTVSEYGKKYSTKVVDTKLTVGQQIDVDIDMFDVVQREFTIDDPNSERFGETVKAHWLFLKVK